MPNSCSYMDCECFAEMTSAESDSGETAAGIYD